MAQQTQPAGARDRLGLESVVPAGTDTPDILCRDLVRIFVTDGIEVQALQGLNLRVDRSEIVAVVGEIGRASCRERVF